MTLDRLTDNVTAMVFGFSFAAAICQPDDPILWFSAIAWGFVWVSRMLFVQTSSEVKTCE